MSEIASHWAKGYGTLSAALDIAIIDIEAFFAPGSWGETLDPAAQAYLRERVAAWRKYRAAAERDLST